MQAPSVCDLRMVSKFPSLLSLRILGHDRGLALDFHYLPLLGYLTVIEAVVVCRWSLADPVIVAV